VVICEKSINLMWLHNLDVFLHEKIATSVILSFLLQALFSLTQILVVLFNFRLSLYKIKWFSENEEHYCCDHTESVLIINAYVCLLNSKFFHIKHAIGSAIMTKGFGLSLLYRSAMIWLIATVQDQIQVVMEIIFYFSILMQYVIWIQNRGAHVTEVAQINAAASYNLLPIMNFGFDLTSTFTFDANLFRVRIFTTADPIHFINFEPLSAALSALTLVQFNGWLSFFLLLYYKLPLRPETHKTYYEYTGLWHIYGLLAMNSWFWSAIYHICDTIWTEKLYFSSDAAFLGYSLILTILRTSSLRDEASRVMVAAPILAFVTTHIMYLNFYELDKGRRKDLNILKQAFISYQLLASASTMHISLSAEFDYSVGPTIGLWGNENKSFEAIRTNRFCMALHITLLKGINSYRSSLKVPALSENKNTTCLAEQLARQFKGHECTNTFLDATIFAFWAKTSVDIEPKRIRLKSSSYTSNTMLDTVTTATVQ
ncbi:hypothetical protein ACJX0J_030954, partial [Zea mays]